jgi:hypothetical protein
MTTTGVSAQTKTVIAPEAVRQVRSLVAEFFSDFRRISPKGFVTFGDPADAEGADFLFRLEVKPDEYEGVVRATSVLERHYYFKYGVNFLIDVHTT